jgi:hypothetical protein
MCYKVVYIVGICCLQIALAHHMNLANKVMQLHPTSLNFSSFGRGERVGFEFLDSSVSNVLAAQHVPEYVPNSSTHYPMSFA